MTEKTILVVSAGNTFPEIRRTQNDFDEWIAQGLNTQVTRIHAPTCTELPDHAEFAGVVVSGSHAMVTDREPWSERLAAWLAEGVAQELPILGICYGHQLLAHATGGRVDTRAQGMEIGTHPIQLTAQAAEDELFGDVPLRFSAQLVHSQSVIDLPAQAQLLAYGDNEPHQAYRIGRCAWGVQFHPEFSATTMRGYIQQMRDELTELNYDAQQLENTVSDTPVAAQLLRRFAALCETRS